MYQRFGKWTKALRPDNEEHPILLWENVKLFDDEDKLFSVYAKGAENWKEIYASVLVFDNDQNDCLAEGSVYRDKLIACFSDAIKKLDNKSGFYDEYRKSETESKKINNQN